MLTSWENPSLLNILFFYLYNAFPPNRYSSCKSVCLKAARLLMTTWSSLSSSSVPLYDPLLNLPRWPVLGALMFPNSFCFTIVEVTVLLGNSEFRNGSFRWPHHRFVAEVYRETLECKLKAPAEKTSSLSGSKYSICGDWSIFSCCISSLLSVCLHYLVLFLFSVRGIFPRSDWDEIQC